LPSSIRRTVPYRIALWHLGAGGALLFTFFSTQWLDYYFHLGVHHASGTFLFFGGPGLAALWLLALGARNAHRRVSVLAIAVTSGLLVLIQCAVLAFAVAYIRGFDKTRSTTGLELVLAGVFVLGSVLIVWFVRGKLSSSATRP
jgi:hypothetical protein